VNLSNKFWFWAALRCIKHLGFPYLDIKRDKTGEWVEAITMTNSQAYLDAIAEIEMEGKR
jgi:hypothetical protein